MFVLTHSISVNGFTNMFAEVSARKSWDKRQSTQISKIENRNPARQFGEMLERGNKA